jgi:hypothetical protein
MDPHDETKTIGDSKLCYPLLDLQTDLGGKYLAPNQRPWAPYYSSDSQMNLSGLVRVIEESQAEALSTCISLRDGPYKRIPEELQIINSHSTSDLIYKLSTAECHERYRSWLSVHDQCTGTVWPMVVFEWYFDFKVHTERNCLVLDASTPIQPYLPTIFINDESQFKPIPQFPYQVLHQTAKNQYITANDVDHYKWITAEV